ncbi:uncharacterized protein LOC110447805 [Mizuhopecten yessoensis]|uniref:uncharacterized protein LOC110447805 n=1 Tax=Mizuhopecten yessoensis TaxID=6573 RepID=UPI000B45B98E|nr:uncharacterized protein LOC110447805 [Mizuhopecten yessoensis]XP_021349413.1 uncharacterized protein LOC110447805 [Mizuhopecten yessoensis]XP_021349414.1 uncharacterized protein LOC110447805 [Mizuhopecten yessoensis]XP_021349415.1 uncharacterized protein LOC110447805 [Mizuhopecten yessoensis]XP_021349416.1 uncharacterized protein LOC110447805 [Mizuhopecten yessoensis]
MSSIGHDAIRKEHIRLVENVDTRYIADYLYQNDFLTPENLEFLTDESRTQRDRCRHLLMTLCKRQYALSQLLNALIHDSSYPYLCTELLITLGEVVASPCKKQRRLSITSKDQEDFTFLGICNPSREIKRTIFTKEHFHATKLYCKLRRSLNQGKHLLYEFDDELNTYQQLWEQNQKDVFRRRWVANRYVEIKVLQMRKLSESGADDNTIQNLFSDIAKLVPYTSHPCASITSLLTIFAHALLTARKPGEEVLSVLNEAKSNFPFLPGCRETSLVLITEFKVYWQIYEKNSDKVTKKELLQKAAAAAMHFAVDEELNEDLVYKLYLNRGLQFLQTLANLGLGYTLRNIRHDCVSKENVDFAKSFLKTVDTEEGWQQMEVRWRMSFNMANSKICFVQGDVAKALKLANSALELSNGIHFKEEHENIQEFIRFISVDGVKEQFSQQNNRTEVSNENNDQHTSTTNLSDGPKFQQPPEVLDIHNKSPDEEKRMKENKRNESMRDDSSKHSAKSVGTPSDVNESAISCKEWYSSRMLQSIGILIICTMLQYIYSLL